ncbi:tripartite tricarboxylate transporter TctB family protein [Oricola indica]|jgi:hypothetical protein|uniref:tripartite tricarboxylate transporter TctB family protein n=1 Tax=Oricola indica TaxID=2872591 RepID=UPI001CBC949D|nr:tripartite tricarboxylate transporter TctB family protein [Oricola indica]
MKRILETDVLGGIVLIAVAVLAAIALQDLPIGTARRMGPAFFPLAMCVIVGLFGIGQLAMALTRRGSAVSFSARKAGTILAGLAVFALLIGRLGLVPAMVALVLTVSFADKTTKPSQMLLLSMALSAVSIALFRYGLGLQLSLFKWDL